MIPYISGGKRLSDCISCQITEEINGIYECEFQVPVNTSSFSAVQEGVDIWALNNDHEERFTVYARSQAQNGIVTFYAHQYCYLLDHAILKPTDVDNCTDAVDALDFNVYNGVNITFDVVSQPPTELNPFKTVKPMPVKQAMSAESGCFLDVYGGEWEYESAHVYYHGTGRGRDTGITLRYGKNITNIRYDFDSTPAYNSAVPFWYNEQAGVLVDGGLVYGSGITSDTAVVSPLDLSDQFDTQPTRAQVIAKAQSILNDTSRSTGVNTRSVTLDFVQLWNTAEYADVAAAEQLSIGDSLNVIYGPSRIQIDGIRIVKTVYDTLRERFISMDLGTPQRFFIFNQNN